jgi:hypothetical protein
MVMQIFARLGRGNAQLARSRLKNVIMIDHTALAASTPAAVAELGALKQKWAAAEARIRELKAKDNAFKPTTSWKSHKTKSTPTFDELRESMAALNVKLRSR